MVMEEIANPHDKFFKESLSREDVARDFARHYLPSEVVSLLDIDSLEVSKDTFVDKSLGAYYSDLLYGFDLKGGGSAFVYLLFEHKSYSEPLVAFHLLRYMVRIWERWLQRGEGRPLPVIIPMVVYHGRGRWKIGLGFEDLFECGDVLRDKVPKFAYLLCDLTRFSDDEIKGMVRLRVALLLLKHIFSQDLPERLPGILGLLRSLASKRSGLEYLETVLSYVASGSDKITEEEIEESLKEALDESGGEIMPTLAEKWVEQGMQQGLQQGMQQ